MTTNHTHPLLPPGRIYRLAQWRFAHPLTMPEGAVMDDEAMAVFHEFVAPVVDWSVAFDSAAFLKAVKIAGIEREKVAAGVIELFED